MQYLPPALPNKTDRRRRSPGGLLKKVSQSSRLGGRESIEIRFCGGVYVAKNTLRASGVSQPRRLRRGKARSAAKLSHQFAKWAN